MLILFLIRRRSIARRSERRNRWWRGGEASRDSFPVMSESARNSAAAGSPAASGGRASARSSFATNFDQGLMFRVDSPAGAPVPSFNRNAFGVAPEFPPMAEVRERNSMLIPSAGAAVRRESLISMMSTGSDPDSQYLVVPTNHNGIEPALSTPMSVRPFSPSESFAFPKPPAQQQSQRMSTSSSFGFGGHEMPSPQSSAATLIPSGSPTHAFATNTSLPSTNTVTYDVPSPVPSLPPLVAAPNPFADPAKAEFSDVEIIRRPFTPTLEDELAVFPGDQVRVKKVFDDGWAFVEKTGPVTERGLIPVDCLREAGQALPAFLAQKRVSSYGGADMTGQPGLQQSLDQMLAVGEAHVL
ncbi:hypothetical protein BV22DRAFT_504063 [Leucogyrophana mollusca]|uniref:Uncharacterized protein n=1 Tax=Leucogyrophana mollusca TaxID=85980 RepID=A0ACB8BG40_9AGAM|nr:hypothetical protein BV22DRAFT_504063 [Leucogyrophana mollusca]